jgi:UDP-N-acetyl-D-mannosaminuronate dehydrogenase
MQADQLVVLESTTYPGTTRERVVPILEESGLAAGRDFHVAFSPERMHIDIWEVVDAASTKPYGFMRLQPGPGMGGHCLPVDPFYLS